MKTSSSRWLVLSALTVSVFGCSSEGPEDPNDPVNLGSGGSFSGGDGNIQTGSGGLGVDANLSGGSTGVDGTGGEIGAGATGGDSAASGGSEALGPVDCGAIANNADWEICEETADSCAAVYNSGGSCDELCASAGLLCGEALENVENECVIDSQLPAVDCTNSLGHQSDYCVCVRDPNDPATSSGGASSGGAAGDGGSSSGGASSGGATGSGGGSNNDGPCAVPSYIQSESGPIGWASQSGGTTGGGSATATLVTSLAQFKTAVAGTSPAVIYVQGTFSPDAITVGSNKTIIGCSSGAHIQGTLKIGKGSSNIILRNVNVSGYGVGNCTLDPGFDSGVGCSSGADAIGVNGDAHHVWIDHCSVKDGTDGNLDITNDADFVTVSWTKFSYTARTDNVGDDSTGASGHRYSNLVGGTNTAPSGFSSSDALGTAKLNVTWHHNWWADNVVERMPRVRYGRNHIYNNYYNSSTANYCARAGIYAHLLIEGNYYDGVDTAHEFNSDDDKKTAYINVGSGNSANVYVNTPGQEAEGGGVKWTGGNYTYTLDAASGIPAVVKSGAGPH